MIQSDNRSFKNKPLSNIQQAQFNIGWRFCPVCGHKLYQMPHECGTIYKIGRKILIRRSVFEEYLREQRKF